MFRILEKEVEDKKNAWLWCPRSFLPKMYTGKIATYVKHIFRVTYVEHVKHMNCSQYVKPMFEKYVEHTFEKYVNLTQTQNICLTYKLFYKSSKDE